MRIVTRPDFDGVVCAVLLKDVEPVTREILWVEPNAMQQGEVAVEDGDMIANLPYHPGCSKWFDHHFSNQAAGSFEGAFSLAPSAARVIFDYYTGRFSRDFSELVMQADKIDSAALSLSEVNTPEQYPHVWLSMTIRNRDESDPPYWNHLVDLLHAKEIGDVMADAWVEKRCAMVIRENEAFRKEIGAHTTVTDGVAVSDFRPLGYAPVGNRFLVYAMYPESHVSVKIRYDHKNPEKVIVSVGHSIFNDRCNVNAGALLSRFQGGGHRGAGACSFPVSQTDVILPEILGTLRKNMPLTTPGIPEKS